MPERLERGERWIKVTVDTCARLDRLYVSEDLNIVGTVARLAKDAERGSK